MARRSSYLKLPNQGSDVSGAQYLGQHRPMEQIANDNPTVGTEKVVNGVLLPAKEKFLTRIEYEALDKEKEGSIKSLSKGLVVTLATCAIGAIVQ